jgi:hypothetical protein
MAGTTSKPNKKTNTPKDVNGKSKSLTKGLNEKVNAAEKKVEEIEKNKSNPSNVTNDLGEAAKHVEEKATPTGTPEGQAPAKEAKQNTESPKEEVIDPEEWFRNTKKEPEETSNKEKESTGNPGGEEPKNKNTPPKGEQGTFDFDFGDKAEDKANSKGETVGASKSYRNKEQALNPNSWEGANSDNYAQFTKLDMKDLRDPDGNPIDWNSVDGKHDIDIGLGNGTYITVPKGAAKAMATEMLKGDKADYSKASYYVARGLGLKPKEGTEAAYVEKSAASDRELDKIIRDLEKDPNEPGFWGKVGKWIKNNPKKALSMAFLTALGGALYNRSDNEKEEAKNRDAELDELESNNRYISPDDEDETLVNNASEPEKATATINGMDPDAENGISDNPDSIEQASDSLNEAINGIPSHLPQDVPDEEEGKEAAAKEYNPTYTPKQEMYDSLNATAEPKGAEPTSTESTVDQLKAADNISNGGSGSTSAPTAKAKTRAKSSKAAPVNNAPMAGSRPDVSAPGYGAADLSAALGQAAQGVPVDGYDRMFDPSFLEYMRRVNPNVAYGIEQEMRRRGM